MEDTFAASWDQMEEYFKEAIEQYNIDVPIILNTLIGLRKLGYDRTFRAGQSLFNFILSRSREHGLREEQAYIVISPGRNEWSVEEGEVKIFYIKDQKEKAVFRTDNPLVSGAFIDLLKDLEREPID
jgi:hypothetical protein